MTANNAITKIIFKTIVIMFNAKNAFESAAEFAEVLTISTISNIITEISKIKQTQKAIKRARYALSFFSQ